MFTLVKVIKFILYVAAKKKIIRLVSISLTNHRQDTTIKIPMHEGHGAPIHGWQVCYISQQ